MYRAGRTLVALTAVACVALLLSAFPAAAQQDAAAAPPEPIQGRLVNVDSEAKTMSVRTEDDQTVQFKYTDTTVISGAEDTIAGLATMDDARVTVHFTEENGEKTATRVEVQPKQQQ